MVAIEQSVTTVAELIDLLRGMPPDAPVIIPFDTIGPGETTKVVVELRDGEVWLSVEVVS